MRIAVTFAFSCAALLAAEWIDRIAVTVGSAAITESRIETELRITALLNGREPVINPDTKRAAAERLIERILMGREIETTRFTFATSEAARPMIEQLKKTAGGDEAYHMLLHDRGISEKALEQNLREQAQLLAFIDFRFRPGVTVSEAELEAIYMGEYGEAWRKDHPGASLPPFDDLREEMTALLTERKVNQQMDDWLFTTRRQTRIIFVDEVFR
jgi:hypothetical protein